METGDKPLGYLACPNKVHECGYGCREAMILLEISRTKSKQEVGDDLSVCV